MIKLKALENFTFGEFAKLKNIERFNTNYDQEGRLLKGDIFETNEKTAKYLLNETPNPANRAVVEVVEVKPTSRSKKFAK